ncbi:hypothetical protein [Caballeronia temeraria]|uniref:hypothetical protein n=1 Tax=Caballeronia temeraria TaxID=1777137 RepID=UPI0007725D06|nr:hypothetical protein [Caballeronia temeraria]
MVSMLLVGHEIQSFSILPLLPRLSSYFPGANAIARTVDPMMQFRRDKNRPGLRRCVPIRFLGENENAPGHGA